MVLWGNMWVYSDEKRFLLWIIMTPSCMGRFNVVMWCLVLGPYTAVIYQTFCSSGVSGDQSCVIFKIFHNHATSIPTSSTSLGWGSYSWIIPAVLKYYFGQVGLYWILPTLAESILHWPPPMRCPTTAIMIRFQKNQGNFFIKAYLSYVLLQALPQAL